MFSRNGELFCTKRSHEQPAHLRRKACTGQFFWKCFLKKLCMIKNSRKRSLLRRVPFLFANTVTDHNCQTCRTEPAKEVYLVVLEKFWALSGAVYLKIIISLYVYDYRRVTAELPKNVFIISLFQTSRLLYDHPIHKDGAPLQFASILFQYLNRDLQTYQIERIWPVMWPPCSLEPITRDLLCCRHVDGFAFTYRRSIHTELKNRIRASLIFSKRTVEELVKNDGNSFPLASVPIGASFQNFFGWVILIYLSLQHDVALITMFTVSEFTVLSSCRFWRYLQNVFDER